MKRILLPTDFSDNSWNAIKYALQLFKNEACNITLLNTYTPLIYQVEYMQFDSDKFGLVHSMADASETGLDEMIQKIQNEFNNPKHTFSKISSFNTLTTEINELYKGKIMDIIVMGTKGATGVRELLFGTNTVHLIKNARCPILAIPSSYSFEPPYEILFPSDYEVDFQEKHIQPIIDIASSFESRMHVLNASRGYDLSIEQEKSRQKLESYFKDMSCSFHSVSSQNVQEAITSFQLTTSINLLVMIKNKHSFFENLFFKSVINQIGFHLNVPFLVIPST
jgi:nucleotide-binding universal stress UspA family protein